jgi:hypothetical protein
MRVWQALSRPGHRRRSRREVLGVLRVPAEADPPKALVDDEADSDDAVRLAEVDEDAPPARRKVRKKKRRPKHAPGFIEADRPLDDQSEDGGIALGGPFERYQSVIDKGAVVGILMMVGAVVWFVCGIVYLDRIFFYPPVMFVLGVLACINGFLRRS